ncbi:tRNA pseudouridine(55) synthase TruB [Helicobacter sp. 16-1353]|nr:tRNA pseudouridine(55) synthase TruB [Helicobacter sp. 16-1353]
MIFVAYKPPFVSSNFYLQSLKHRYKIKKIGYSGTLDPFASGVLVIATGSYTKLLNHINLSPKVYIATVWLGAESSSLDMENISKVNIVSEFSISQINKVLHSLKGKITYTPPIFSAKKINGIRAYKLARDNQPIELSSITTEVFDINLLHYSHPFLSFKIIVQKGTYIRSIGYLIANKLGVSGTLSNLIRIKEGNFCFENYKILPPLDILTYEKINLKEYEEDFKYGRKIILKNDKISKNKRYIAIFDNFFSIIEFNDIGEIRYILNNLEF